LAKRNETPAAVPAEKTDVKPSSKGAPVAAKAKPAGQKQGFKLNEFIVYPAHGVGQIVGVETQEVAGFSLELFVVSFIKDKMILKVPTSKVGNVGMRKLAETNVVDKALATLSGRARIKRTMWSRRAQEYEAKINSGDLVTIAEVVRDLYRSDTQPEQSYSERQLYEAALDRMAREIAAVRKLIDSEALKLIESFLQKGPRRGQKADGEAGDEGDAGNERGVTAMADKEFEITTNTYIFAAVGAVLIGGLAAAALGGLPNTIAAAVVGGLAGGCLGLFF
jgi:CarD family transcriptional regulator